MISAAGEPLNTTEKSPVVALNVPVPSPVIVPLASEEITNVPLVTLNVEASMIALSCNGLMFETNVS